MVTVSGSVVLELFVAVAQQSGRKRSNPVPLSSPSYSGQVVKSMIKVKIFFNCWAPHLAPICPEVVKICLMKLESHVGLLWSNISTWAHLQISIS